METLLLCVGENNNSIVCNSCHNTIFLYGRHNHVQAECGTKIVFSVIVTLILKIILCVFAINRKNFIQMCGIQWKMER